MNITNQAKNIYMSREDYAYETIKEAILSGDLRPSQKISLTELAKSLGVSIIPVNHAVRRLTSEGLIKQDPHHSPYVAEFSSQNVTEVLTIRYHLEELALREAAPNIGPEEIAFLRTNFLVPMQEAVQNKDSHAYGSLNRAFHMTVYGYSHLQMLCELINDLWNKAELNRCRSVFALVPNMAAHSLQEHVQLVDMLEKGDIQNALEVLMAHKNYSRAKLLESLERLDA